MNLPPDTTALDAAQLFHNAQQLHQAGELRQAEHLYREVLRREPSHAAARGALGVIGCQTGNVRAGAQLLREALALAPQDADLNNNLGMALLTLGEPRDAIAQFERAIAARPRFAEAHFNCANALHTVDELDAAEKHFRAALRLRADYVDAANNLGHLLFERGRAEESAQLLQRVAQLAPRFAAGHLGLARALAASGRADEAVAACRRGLAIDDRAAASWEMLGVCLRQAGDLQGATQALARAVALAPNSASLQDQLGLLQLTQGQVDVAAQSFANAERLSPDQAQLATHVGLSLSARGDRQAARQAFERALALAPAHGEALRNLAEMAESDAEVVALRKRVEQALQCSQATVENSDLLFALGRLRDREGDYAGAFESFAAANVLRRRQVPFDERAQRAFIDAIIETFSPDFMQRAAAIANPDQRPVFIVGMPRAGTSLVEQIAASHPHLHGAGELTFFPEQIPAVVRRAGQPSNYPWGISRRLNELAALAPRYLALLSERAGDALRVSDKMPYNFLYLGVIGALFPRARVIHCRRSPLATCHSIFTRDLAGSHPYSYDLDSLAAAYLGYHRLMAHWREVLSISTLEIDYETLIEDQIDQSRRLLDFLGLAWNARCLRFHESGRAVVTASQWQVRRPLYAEARDHWRHYRRQLAPLELALQRAGMDADGRT